MKPATSKFTILKQVVDTIPAYLVPKLARKYDIDSRSFSPWSHVVSLAFSQVAHSLSLNDVCDTLRNHESALSTLRGATPPSRNGLSHANRVRNSEMAKDLFYEVLAYLNGHFPRFGRFDKSFKLSKKMKRTINIVDSSTIALFANCMDWAKHRRRKAAAKCHMLMDAQTFLPKFVVVKTAKSSDAVIAHELCARLQDGEIVIFDKAYVDFLHLQKLTERNVYWVTRAKDNMAYKIVNKRSSKDPTVLLDAEIELTTHKSHQAYPNKMRLIHAMVKRDGKMVKMEGASGFSVGVFI
jgi:hypothetical protein